MNYLEVMKNDLTCPIDLDLFQDPISVPCCGKAFNRLALVQHLEFSHGKKCPMCKQSLENFDAVNAQKNVLIMSMLESFIKLDEQAKMQNNQLLVKLSGSAPSTNKPKWMAELVPIVNNYGNTFGVGELKINLENSKFIPRPSLFIAVVDRSGSMGGNPWRQVETALIHIMSLTRSNPFVKTVIVAYDSDAQIINTTGSQTDVNRVIKTMFTGGGTNFNAAFNKVKDVLEQYICSDSNELQGKENNVGSVTVAFLTDGESQGDRNSLVSTFRQILKECWQGPLSVHSIGFGKNCDREFLEGLWKTGSVNGTFRYAEPEDDGDTLCGKLTTLFSAVSSSSTVQINLELDQCTYKLDNKLANQTKTQSQIQFPINDKGKGQYSLWVNYTEPQTFGSVTINSCMDNNIVVPIVLKENNTDAQKILFEKWISVLIDDLASEILDLSTKDKKIYGENVFALHLGLIRQRITAVKICVDQKLDGASFQRLEFLKKEIDALSAGSAVNKGKLGDLRFGEQYISSVPKNIVKSITEISCSTTTTVCTDSEEKYVRYSRNNFNKARNILQEIIINCTHNKLTNEVREAIDKSTIEDLNYKDIDGNTALILSAYCGNSFCTEYILKKYPSINLTETNNNGETAITLAIKKNGYWKTINVLMQAGATIPDSRKKALERYCINKQYRTCADIISKCDNIISTDISNSMTAESIKFIYERATKNGLEINTDEYMKICLSKCMLDMVKELVEKHHVRPTLDMIFDLCIPGSDNYVTLVEYLLTTCEIDINQKNSENDTLLFRASEKGSLGHVQLFLSRGATVDLPNSLGNTALWIACCNRYVDIVIELLNANANVNYPNLKGNTPLVPVCQRGPVKIAEILLAAGATVDQLNSNGDSVILLCCRNGQADVLKLLLNKADPAMVKHAAHIDGFCPILAATESDRSDCINVLFDYGVDLEQKTSNDNPILSGATSLHLAAYYGCLDAAKTLLRLGANPNSIDINQSTPMHIAVIQGQTEIVKLLKNANANCMAKDLLGLTPLSYCRGNETDEIRQILIDPIYGTLMSLARGEFSTEEEKLACNLLVMSAGAIGCLSKKDAVDIFGQDGKTPLMEAIIHSTHNIVKVLLELGADPLRTNLQGINSYVWSEWIGNIKIKQLMQNSPTTMIHDYIQRLKLASSNVQNATMLYLASKPSKNVQLFTIETGIYKRMDDFIINILRQQEIVPKIFENKKSIQIVNKDMSLTDFFDKNAVAVFDSQNLTNSMIWSAKIFTTNLIASRTTNLGPQHIMAIYMYTTNTNLSKIVNTSLLNNDFKIMGPYIQYLYNGISSLPIHCGEVFRGTNFLADRKQFMVGNEISWPVFTSASTIWKIAIENTKNFSTKKKEGTVFLIKSKTGRYIGQYSQFTQDTEIIFLPYTKFRVSAWFVGNIIALGQENIRHSTFKIKVEEMDKMINSNTSLIIELEELN
jgi:ankyrin repeat protein/uncharacterized protein YegL